MCSFYICMKVMIYPLLNMYFYPWLSLVANCSTVRATSSLPRSLFLSSIMESSHEDLRCVSEACVPGKKMEEGKSGPFPLGKEKGGGLSLMW